MARIIGIGIDAASREQLEKMRKGGFSRLPFFSQEEVNALLKGVTDEDRRFSRADAMAMLDSVIGESDDLSEDDWAAAMAEQSEIEKTSQSIKPNVLSCQEILKIVNDEFTKIDAEDRNRQIANRIDPHETDYDLKLDADDNNICLTQEQITRLMSLLERQTIRDFFDIYKILAANHISL